MAEILVKLQANYISGDARKNKGIYQRGDIICVKPDGHLWGKEEHPKTTTYSPPRCMPIKIPDLTVKEAEQYLQVDEIQHGIPDTDTDVREMVNRRLYKVDIDNLPIADKNTINKNGELTKNFNDIKNLIKNKKINVVRR